MGYLFYFFSSILLVIYLIFARENRLFYDCLFIFCCFCIIFIFSFISLKNFEFFFYSFFFIFELKISQNLIFLEVNLDTLSFFFLGLTTLIFSLSLYYSCYTIHFRIRLYLLSIALLFFLLLILFSTVNLFLFYFVFEISLLPMFFLIGIWGSRTRRIRAVTFFFMYSAVFSAFFFFLLIVFWFWVGSYNYYFLKFVFFPNYEIIWEKSVFIWVCLFFTFSAKLPVIPFHIWLPEAHVEAPTVGSVILASILLKIGAYGSLRFLICFIVKIHIYFFSLVYIIGIISILYSTFMAVIQVDLKKIIAYSSIAHMNLGLLGLFSFSSYGKNGSSLLFFGHSFISAALFFLVGCLYVRFNTRLLKYYSGLNEIMPVCSFFFMYFSFANIGFPGTVNFISELLIFCSIILNMSFFIFILLGISFVSSLLYSIWLYNRIFHGAISQHILISHHDQSIFDLFYYEKVILGILMIFVTLLGFFPNIILDIC